MAAPRARWLLVQPTFRRNLPRRGVLLAKPLVPARTRLDGAVAVQHSSGTVTVRSSVSPWSCQQ